jgi:hypothetical protein
MMLISNRCPAYSRREMLKVEALAAVPLMPASVVRGFLDQERICHRASEGVVPHVRAA